MNRHARFFRARPGARPTRGLRWRGRDGLKTNLQNFSIFAGITTAACGMLWWWNGRHEGLKIPWAEMSVRVRVPSEAREKASQAARLFCASAGGILTPAGYCRRPLLGVSRAYPARSLRDWAVQASCRPPTCGGPSGYRSEATSGLLPAGRKAAVLPNRGISVPVRSAP